MISRRLRPSVVRRFAWVCRAWVSRPVGSEDLLQDDLADGTGYPLRYAGLRQTNTPRARKPGQPRSTTRLHDPARP
jgi:hypothetical protein